jgi:hypothetical protein
VIAKVEWHQGELYPRVGFIVTNMSRPAENVVAFYNKRGTCEQWIKEGKGAIKWTRLSCRTFAANAVRLQLHVLAYNLGNFLLIPFVCLELCAPAHPDLVCLVLKKEAWHLPGHIRISAFYTMSDRSRSSGVTGLLKRSGNVVIAPGKSG